MLRAKDFGEFGLIDEIQRIIGDSASRPGVALGIGDDTAVMQVEPGRDMLATCDMLVEGVHFRLRPEHAYAIGRKAMAVNISDIAAMGGRPAFALIGLALTPDAAWRDVRELMKGLVDEAKDYGVAIVGGDTVGVRRELAVHVTLLGDAEAGRAISRSGARVGDWVGVTGDLGASAAGLALLESSETELDPAIREAVVHRHVRPVPRVEVGQALARSGVTAMIDLSDGLAGDLQHVCRSSGVGAIIDAPRIPVASETRTSAAALGVDPLDWALTGGEDYELLFTIPPARWDVAVASVGGAVPLTRIGHIVAAEAGVTLRTVDGRAIPFRRTGFVHF